MWRNRGKQEYLSWQHSYPSPCLLLPRMHHPSLTPSSRAASEAREDACRNSTPDRGSATLPPPAAIAPQTGGLHISNTRISLLLHTNHKRTP
jgi:hypothetical protein